MATTGSDAGLRINVAGATKEFPPGRQVVIGRDQSCDVVVDNQYVSRVHAVLSIDGTSWRLDSRGQRGVTFQGAQVTSIVITGPTEIWLGSPEAGERVEILPLGISTPATVVVGTGSPPTVVSPGGAMQGGGGLIVRLNGRDLRFPDGKVIVIGRQPTADVRTDNPTVSRQHAQLRQESGVWILESSGRTGTRQDGVQVTRLTISGPTTVQIGDPNQPDTLELIPGSGATAPTQVPLPVPQAAATRVVTPQVAAPAPIPGGALTPARAGTGQTSVVRRLTQSNRRTQFIAVIAAIVAVVLGGAAIFFAVTSGGSRNVEGVILEATPKTALIRADGRSNGTGWVWSADRGFVVTNAHVVEDGSTFQVGINGDIRSAELLGIAPCDDLAVLRVSDTSDLQEFRLGSRDELNPGEEVVALGYPVSTSSQDRLQATEGTISNPSTDWADAGYNDVIQHTATVNPGNSGGPLVDLDGLLIGVNTFKVTDSAVSNQYYSIPSDRVQEIGTTLASGVSLGDDGIGPRRLSVITTGTLPGIPQQFVLIDAERRGPASDAGVGPFRTTDGSLGTYGILSIDGQPIATPGDYCNAIRDIRPGERAQYTVIQLFSSGDGYAVGQRKRVIIQF